MEVCTAGSNSSVWGSALMHMHDLSRRSVLKTETESRVSMEIKSKSGQTALITGSRDVVCKTAAEFKANKLNRYEQTKLESMTLRVLKEQEIARRKFKQSERLIRAKSARIVERIQTLGSSSCITDKPMSSIYEKRPKSEPFSRRVQASALPESSETIARRDGQCKMCEKIQMVIQMYEKEGRKTGILAQNDNHSTCLFSDAQIQTFLCMLEAKYFSDTPELSHKLRESGILTCSDRTGNGTKMSINNNIAKKKVELRIQQFCQELENYKKRHNSVRIPKEVQDSVEKIRLENAVLTVRQSPTKQEQLRKEVEEMLRL